MRRNQIQRLLTSVGFCLQRHPFRPQLPRRNVWQNQVALTEATWSKIVATKALPNLAMFEINPSVLQIGRYRQQYIYTGQNKRVYCIASQAPLGYIYKLATHTRPISQSSHWLASPAVNVPLQCNDWLISLTPSSPRARSDHCFLSSSTAWNCRKQMLFFSILFLNVTPSLVSQIATLGNV